MWAMCGRYASSASTAELAAQFGLEQTVGDDVVPSWNVAPTDAVRAVVKLRPHQEAKEAPPVRQLRTMRWGLVPSWAKDRKGAARMINARAETVTERPAFKAAAARRRCLLPALGYYEWQKSAQGKVPYFLHAPDREILALAGLYELWPDPMLPADDQNRWLWTCTIITQPATDLLGQIHDRTPVVVPAALHEAWLDCASDDPDTARRLLKRVPAAHLAPYVVSSAVNSVRNDGPELIEAVDAAPLPPKAEPLEPC